MVLRLIYILLSIAYLNTVFYQDGAFNDQKHTQIIDGSTLIAIILDDVLDLPVKNDATPDFQYDKYRLVSSPTFSTELADRLTSTVSCDDSLMGITLVLPKVYSKIRCLPGYYQYLFRLKPF